MSVHAIGSVALVVWELPQNLLGLVLLALMRRRITERRRETGRLFLRTPSTGVSLGWFVFWCSDESIRLHEYGHTIQSKLLGPLNDRKSYRTIGKAIVAVEPSGGRTAPTASSAHPDRSRVASRTRRG